MRTFLGLFAVLAAGLSLPAQDRSKPLVVVLIGPPASGKTTQADYLRLKYKLPVVTVEELIAQAKPGLRRGDKAVNELVRKHLETIDAARGFALDGYPATRAQADYLAGLLREKKLPSPVVIQIEVPDEVVYQRSAQRGEPGDKREIISRRLAEYRSEMAMIRSYYPDADIWTIDGTRPPEGVSATIRLLIEDRDD